jgi:hypothetical protein
VGCEGRVRAPVRAVPVAMKPGADQQATSAIAGTKVTQTASTFKALALEAAVHSLFVSLKAKPKQEKFEDFLPRCLDHTKSLVGRVDKSYTDMQLEANLLHQCEMEKQFPRTYDHGFNNHEACKDFAKKLADARMEELENGKTDKYEEFCASYYEHVYPSKEKKAAPKKSGAVRGSSLVAGAAVLGLGQILQLFA